MKLKPFFNACLFLLFSNLIFGQTTYVFVGTFNRDKQKEGVAVYALDLKNGKLTKTSSINGILNPSYLAVGANKNYLYACTETQTKNSGYITSFKFDKENGKLTPINRQKTSGENPVFLTTDKNNRYLLSVNYTGSGLDVFPLLADGSVGTHIQSIKYKEGSNATERQNVSHPHSIIFSPDYSNIFIPDLGADAIKSYSINFRLKTPVETSTLTHTASASASGPRHICFHPSGKYVYCVEEISGSVSSYKYEEGKLKLIERLMLHQGSHGDYNSADIHSSPDGKFLYVSNRGTENNIAIYSVIENGQLIFAGYQSTLGNHPRMFAISPDGQYLIVANQLSNSIIVFKRNTITGKLTPVKQNIEIENPSCVQIQAYN